MIFEIVFDFAEAIAAMPNEHPRYRILRLLNEAIRRDVHFINRHSTTLFKYLWCWWYDCREAADYYQNASGPWCGTSRRQWNDR
jgi:hypothetical protein